MAKIDYAALKKGGFMRQKQKGYFSLRIQVVGGNLTSENIRAVADVADKYGKGYVHMTSGFRKSDFRRDTSETHT